MLLWRVTMRELAAKLDELDVLLHELHVRLSKEEDRLRDQADPPPSRRRSSSDEV
jgi:hypothetical protein